MIIDCDKCELRNVGCADCVVTAMPVIPESGLEIGPLERRALGILAAEGLIPPLRLTISVDRAS
ncbi:hypothetical protein NE236_11935 [Actinoallomurus purpureus]|uniref:hypothetical protein n=1 Tax=Actinoallomurus purpureus TaxID=478114 RepID=UPI0020933865|nr:hypothetical protein [Actinoallomurus purpureus]MCO6005693.1 hypothetical protein [Actinoallomurus purpureus]